MAIECREGQAVLRRAIEEVLGDAPRIKIVLNGYTTTEYVETDPQMRSDRVVALHMFRSSKFPNMQVSFKDIMIKELR